MIEVDRLKLLKHGGGRSGEMGLWFNWFLGLLCKSKMGLCFMRFVEMGIGFLGSVGVEVDGFESL